MCTTIQWPKSNFKSKLLEADVSLNKKVFLASQKNVFRQVSCWKSMEVRMGGWKHSI